MVRACFLVWYRPRMSRHARVRTCLAILGAALAAAAAAAAPAAASTPEPAGAAPLWACHPAQAPNPCTEPLATTVLGSTTIQPRRVLRVERPQPAADAPVDCFFVYPTVVDEPRANAPLRSLPEVRAILRFQASRFSQLCDVYAPVYRQTTLLTLAAREYLGARDDDVRAAAEVAYGDVRAAWRHYLRTDNRGRGIVVIGHSQGSALLTRLLDEEVDDVPQLRARIVSAMLIGGNVTTRRGARTGGDFEHLPTCASADEAGCVIAYSMYGTLPSGRTAIFGRVDTGLRSAFGRPIRDDLAVACVDPVALAGDAVLEPLTRSEAFPGLVGLGTELLYLGLRPRAATPWVRPGERYRATCETANGVSHLRVRAANRATIVPFASPTPDWGLHLGDVNLALGNLLRVAERQIAAYGR